MFMVVAASVDQQLPEDAFLRSSTYCRKLRHPVPTTLALRLCSKMLHPSEQRGVDQQGELLGQPIEPTELGQKAVGLAVASQLGELVVRHG